MAIVALAWLPSPLSADVSYLYALADFSGPVLQNGPHLYLDRHHDEVYLLHANQVRVFNESGMEVYRFAAAPELGFVMDLVADARGDLLVLSRHGTTRGEPYLTRCTYRGEPERAIARVGWPADYADLEPERLFLREERLFQVDVSQMRIVETTLDGEFVAGHDLGALLGIDVAKRSETRIKGISLDPDGRFLITVPVLFRAFVVSLDGDVDWFGKPGSGPGKFGVVGGIASDERGRLFVSDRLRHVVMEFDENLQFVREFGKLGVRPENLLAPSELAWHDGALYVTQLGGRGVSVFSVSSDRYQAGGPSREVSQN